MPLITCTPYVKKAFAALKKVGGALHIRSGDANYVTLSTDKLTAQMGQLGQNYDSNERYVISDTILTTGSSYYFEIKVNNWRDSAGNLNYDTPTYGPYVGIIPENATTKDSDGTSLYYYTYGFIVYNGQTHTNYTKLSPGGVVGFMVDLANGLGEVYVNGVKQGNTISIKKQNYRVFAAKSNNTSSVTARFGDTGYTYPPAQ